MQTDPAGHVKLSIRETQILKLLCAEGLSNKELAHRMRLADGTVAGYMDELMSGLHIYSRNVLMVWGWQHPEAMRGEWSDRLMHKPGCTCGKALCSLLELAA